MVKNRYDSTILDQKEGVVISFSRFLWSEALKSFKSVRIRNGTKGNNPEDNERARRASRHRL
jgi:hypothetical protein